MPQEFRLNEGKIGSKNQIEFCNRMDERCMDAAQGPAIMIDIRNHDSEGRIFGGISHNFHVLSERACYIQRMPQERSPRQFEQGLVAAHSRALAACEDESCNSFHLQMIQPRLWMQVSPSCDRLPRHMQPSTRK